MNENDRNLSPCRRLGYHVGDLFQTTEHVLMQYMDEGGNPFVEPALDFPLPGSLVRLVDDDNTEVPYFCVVMGYNSMGEDLTDRTVPLRLGTTEGHVCDVEPIPKGSDVGPTDTEGTGNEPMR